MPLVLQQPFQDAIQACTALIVSHGLSCAFIMYMDLSGRWTPYSLNANRVAKFQDYWVGWKSFLVDQTFLFLPFMTFCFWYNAVAIQNCNDSWTMALFKLGTGFCLGKLWAFGTHYCLHIPSLYCIHRRHHMNPKAIVASGAWLDSMLEYSLM